MRPELRGRYSLRPVFATPRPVFATLRPVLAALLWIGFACIPAQQQGEPDGSPPQELTSQQVASLRAAIQEVGGRAIIGFKPAGANRGVNADGTPALSPDQVRDHAASLAPLDVVVLRQFQQIPAVSVRMDPGRLEEVLRNPNVEYVEPDRLVEPGSPGLP